MVTTLIRPQHNVATDEVVATSMLSIMEAVVAIVMNGGDLWPLERRRGGNGFLLALVFFSISSAVLY